MTTNSSILAWRIPRTEEPGGLQSIGSQRVVHNWACGHDNGMALILSCSTMGFPVSSAGKEPSCNAGDPDFIPGSGRSAGEGIGYPLQYSWTSLVAQMVKNLRVMQQTWVWSLGWKDPLEKGTATHSNILARRIPWAEEPGRLHTVHGITKNWTWLSDFHSPWLQSGFV